MGRFLRNFPGLRGVAIVALSMCPLALSQESRTQPQTVVDVLHQLSEKADVLFAGQVVAIRHTNSGVVEIEFRVDQAIRGCSAGTPYILREWAGLWAADNQRYRVGQRLLMLLHAPSAGGMSSPVDGLDGAIPIRQGGQAAPLTDIATPRQPPFVDLRWLGTRLPRSVSYRRESVHAANQSGVAVPFVTSQQTTRIATAGSIVSAVSLGAMASKGSMTDGSVPAQQASVDAVMGMLTSWEKARHVVP